MKTKFALLFLPALMALSSCGAAKTVVEKTFLEDTTAHSEIFGNQDVLGGQLQIKKRDVGAEIASPKIGYQIKYQDSKLAIRFVAAVKDLNVKAYWRRGVAGSDGTQLQSKSFGDDTQQAFKYYTSVSDGTNTLTAGVTEGYEDYVGFVVYSIYNIPYSANKNAYVAAYLNLVGDENNGVDYKDVHSHSRGLAVRIERLSEDEENPNSKKSKDVFAFDPTMNKHFLAGTINNTVFDGGANGLYEESAGTPGGNHAWYENVSLKKTDSFGSFYYDQDRIFQYFVHESYFDRSDAKNTFRESNMDGFNSPFLDGQYDIYISNGSSNKSDENHVFPNTDSTTGSPRVYFYPGFWDNQTAADYAIYAWGEGVPTIWSKLVNTEVVNGKTIYVYDLDFSSYDGLKFTRMEQGTAEGDYNWNDPPCYNQTNNWSTEWLLDNPYYAIQSNDWNNSTQYHFNDL